MSTEQTPRPNRTIVAWCVEEGGRGLFFHDITTAIAWCQGADVEADASVSLEGALGGQRVVRLPLANQVPGYVSMSLVIDALDAAGYPWEVGE